MLPYSFAIGIRDTCSGTASSTITTTSNQSRPGNWIHANAYPASAPMITTSAVAGRVIAIVLMNEPMNWELPSRFA